MEPILIYDGDECNVLGTYSPIAQREAKELMFTPLHMASLSSSSLLIGYHQDVVLAAHILSLASTYLTPEKWHRHAKTSYEMRWKSKYTTYEDWFKQFSKRCVNLGVNIYSGKGLYSTILPEGFNWTMGSTKIVDGILTQGILDKKNLSSSPSSMGMIIYRAIGSAECVSWLNVTYTMLNQYLIERGLTLGFNDILLTESQDKKIRALAQIANSRSDLKVDVEKIQDPILRAKKELEITQELNNVREAVSIIVINNKDINDPNTDVRRNIYGPISMYISDYIINSDTIDMKSNKYVLLNNFSYPTGYEYDTKKVKYNDKEYKILKFPSNGGILNIDMYQGEITWIDPKTKVIYKYPMSIVPVIKFQIEGKTYKREFKSPNPLKMMVESGARGNVTNAIQISGIIGQMIYGDGRIPNMLPPSQFPEDVLEGNHRGSRSIVSSPFGDLSPSSKGFIDTSYVEGMVPSQCISAHITSRENLISNVKKTPQTGYYGRRMRVFLENQQIKEIQNKKVTANERDIIINWVYLTDPSRMFKIGNNMTFVDINMEVEKIRSNQIVAKEIVCIHVTPMSMKKYARVDDKLRSIINGFKNRRVILLCDPEVEKNMEYMKYLRTLLPQEVGHKDLHTIVKNKPLQWISGISKYDTIIYIPIDTKAKFDNKYVSNLLLPFQKGASSYIDTTVSDISGISYQLESGKTIPINILYKMMINGSSFMKAPILFKPSKDLQSLLEKYTLLESLIINGDVYSM